MQPSSPGPHRLDSRKLGEAGVSCIRAVRSGTIYLKAAPLSSRIGERNPLWPAANCPIPPIHTYLRGGLSTPPDQKLRQAEVIRLDSA
ncbi:hypothetical protein Cob_v008961 [Colletotrichum orbiculare MAFF 240422]|uniref:Uncharacterized protein n=1 Tax=Colletotrichum orbiculare (strain 104-T / ATCC 96160 / CBS 514.97 / LARS 414 / MAFF 240422) TaxID=1213857 RepID=A0A484FKK4_COLOR|nr:hypothetical protein Cob_v008961 [Colletotrichum orbiculare MAFF 240422]